MNKAQLKSISLIMIFLIVLSLLIYAVTTTLITPADNTIDTDGFLDLRGSCVPTTATSTTMYNITAATLYHNMNAAGTWAANKTINVTTGVGANATFYFNFTNVVNSTAEGTYRWNILCFEQNESNGTISTKNTAFAGNNTIIVQYAKSTVSISTPEDNILDLDGGLGVNFTGSATPPSGWNITKVFFYTNHSGTWRVNQTYNPNNPSLGTTLYFNFSNTTDLNDGARIVWGFAVNQTLYNGSNFNDLNTTRDLTQKLVFSENRTLKIERPANISINRPSDSNWSKNAQVRINFSINGIYTSKTNYDCQLWTNQTDGNWIFHSGFPALNGSQANEISPTFEQKTFISYAIRCAEKDDQNVYNFSINSTIRIDTVDPTLTVHISNDTTFNSTISLNFTASDNLNLSGIEIHTNFSGGNDFGNYSNDTPISGEKMVVVFPGIADGIYSFRITINDSAGHVVTSNNRTIIVDTLKPNIFGIRNVSVTNYCDRANITWSTNESTYFTIYSAYNGTTTTYTNTTREFNNSYILDFDFNGEVDYTINITSCDIANNCNTSNAFTFTTPARVCQGWNYYQVYDAQINLSVLQNQSGADLLYFWNQTKQNWVFMTAGSSANSGNRVGRKETYHVVALYENTNSTWFRNTTNNGYYNYNVTVGDNFLGVPTNYNFGNLTWTFANNSDPANVKIMPAFIANETHVGALDNAYGPFNFTIFAAWNGSSQRWVSHDFNHTWVNASVLQPYKIEAFWIYSGNFNVTWNGTSISRNWTRYS